jgi:hypothetical protein
MGGKAATARAGSSETVQMITTRQICKLERWLQISELAPIGWVGRYSVNNGQAIKKETYKKVQKCKGKTNEKDDACKEAERADCRRRWAGRKNTHEKQRKVERNETKVREREEMKGMASSY